MIKFQNLLKYALTSLGVFACVNLVTYADLEYRQEGDEIIYQIGSVDDLKTFSRIVSDENNFANAELVSDIDFNQESQELDNILGSSQEEIEDQEDQENDLEEFLKIGSSSSPFSGSFNGQGYKIKNFNNLNNNQNPALFGNVGKNGVIKSLDLENFYIKSGSNISGLCEINNGLIDSCSFNGQLYGSENIAAICLENNGKITNCFTRGCIIGDRYVSGVCVINKGEISNCCNLSRIYGFEYVAGLVAQNEETVENCANLGYISGDKKVGSFIGVHLGLLVLDSCNINDEFICDVGVASCSINEKNKPEDGMFLDDKSKEKYKNYISEYKKFVEITDDGKYFDRNKNTLEILEDLINNF
ncbi:MAG: hypothetical protein J6C55_04160 [Oscillospiraceae bacterium]|nr:hypothetical protein [Oscillospiraceae bacterium]